MSNQTPQRRGQPGAMTMAMQAVANRPVGPKVLRIGLIQGDKIVEERIIRKRETVSVGTSEKNQFIVSGGRAPELPLRPVPAGRQRLHPQLHRADVAGGWGCAGGVQVNSTSCGPPAGPETPARPLSGEAERYLPRQDRHRRRTTLLFQFVDPAARAPPGLSCRPRPVGGFVAEHRLALHGLRRCSPS